MDNVAVKLPEIVTAMHLNHIGCVHTRVVQIGVLVGHHIEIYTLASTNLLLTNKVPGPLSIHVGNATPK